MNTLGLACKDVTAVLLADGWHHVHDATFKFRTYLFIFQDAFDFVEAVDGGDLLRRISGPATSILALRRPIEPEEAPQ